MVPSKHRRIAAVAIYVVLAAGIVWQAKVVAGLLWKEGTFPQTRSYRVTVSGDVRRPGLYRVPEGTTQFEILKVAGVRPTSDLSAFSLMAAVDENKDMNIGSREERVALNQAPPVVRLEFFFGDVTFTSKDGRSLPVQEGIGIGEGDRIQTESAAQAEISIGSFSRMDIDNFSDVAFEKIGGQEKDRSVMELFQRTGACWYKIAYTEKNELHRILTPPTAITVGGNGADFLVEVQPDKTTINLMDGTLLLERTGGGESINLITGQTAGIYNDGRPFQVSRLAPDLSASERFMQLSQEKKSAVTKNAPFNFLFCGTPAVFFLVTAQYDKGVVSVIHVPPRLLVERFAQGITTLDEAYLYGGPSFVNSLLERILDIRLSRYCVFTKDNILRTADVLGGITASLDGKSSSLLTLAAGRHKLSSRDLLKLLSPSSGTPEEARARQRQLLGALFDNLRGKDIVLTSAAVSQILSSIESNMNAQEVMDCYLRFSTGGSWTRKDIDLPVTETKIKGGTVYEPVLEKCKGLLESP